MISFSGFNDIKIFNKILLIFPEIINLLRKSILNYWIYIESIYEVLRFIDIILIDVIFQYELLRSHVEREDLLSNRKYMHDDLEIDYQNWSSNSYEYNNI